MGIFDSIKDAIFGNANAAEQPADTPSGPSTPPTSSPTQTPKAPPPQSTTTSPVDIAVVMERAVAAKGQKLNWRTSIVDTMKALNLDSSLAARKELANELGYTGDTGGSAAMNIWLHKALMKKLAENGGKIPGDLIN